MLPTVFWDIMLRQYHINLIVCSTLRDLSVNYTSNISLDSRGTNVTDILLSTELSITFSISVLRVIRRFPLNC